MNIYRADAFSSVPWLEHGFGTRGVALSDYLMQLGLKDSIFAKTNQRHGNRVFVIDDDMPREVLEGDGFLTQTPGVVCFVRTADCVPVLLCDPENRAVGAIHAGWRGHVCDVIGHAVREMKNVFGTDSSKLLAAIGPSICPSCYFVGEEVIGEFRRNGFASALWNESPSRNGYSLNLKRASRELLISSGLDKNNIATLELCTSCHNGDFASYRREKTDNSRQVNFICMK